MKQNLKILMSSALFHDVGEKDLENMLKCLAATEKRYQKNDIIIMAGTKVTSVGIIIEGTAQITREDAEGNRAILSDLSIPDLFAEAYVAASMNEVPITVIATSDCKVVWVPFGKIVARCAFACEFHRVIVENMLKVIAEKNILMNEKMRLLSCKTTKEKLLTYLSDYSERVGKSNFVIPFTRNELADFLSVDRSAMSRELGRLRDEGYIKFHKNEFELLLNG